MSVEQDVYRIRHATYGEEVRESIADAIESMNVKVEATEEARQDAIEAAEQAEEYRDETQQIVDDAVDDIYERVVEEADDTYAPIATSLLEAEDREIIFNTIAESVQDSLYSELRSAPIHNAITIGQSVYPRMDRTRMAIDAIKGRSVAFNQLVMNGNFPNTTGWTAASASISASSNVLTMTTTGIGYCETSVGDIINGHKYLFAATINTNSTNMNVGLYKSGTAISGMYQSGNWSTVGRIVRYSVWSASSTYTSATVRVRHNAASASSTTIEDVMLIDLTAMYGTTLADSIYAMEQATTGAGVAYVRQRMDLDYYAANAGELKAPVVSGVSFAGKNLFDLNWWVAQYPDQCSISNGVLSVTAHGELYANGIAVDIPLDNGAYISVDLKNGTSANARIRIFFENGAYYAVGQGSTTQWGTYVLAIPAELQLKKIVKVTFDWSTAGVFEVRNLLIALGSSATAYTPYHSTTLSLPSTRLDGVGTAQDVMYVREDGENDYSLILSNKADEDAFSALNWSYEADTQRFYAPISNLIKSDIDGAAQTRGLMCDADYEIIFSNGMANYTAMTNVISTLDKIIWQYTNNSGVPNLNVKDTRYTTVEAFVAAMGAKKIAYEVATPTETVIAEHLTLADISAIAENGGIISVENSNGHIVQPDLELDGFKIDTYKRDLDLKASLASPAFTGTPTAPTPSASDNTTKLSTTAFVHTAVNAEKTRAMAVEATKADKSYADYILLREEEDRQILFGSIVEAATDEYSELRAAPIHNAITIGGSVYPRMDRTRMAIDAIRGRTVAFNQMMPATAKSYSATLTTTQTYNIVYANGLSVPVSGAHVYMISADLTRNIATNDRIDLMLWKQDDSYLYLTWANGAANGNRARIVKTTDGTIVSAALNNYSGKQGFTEGDTLSLDNVMLTDLTAMYGTTLADSIYAMEQATTGAGVAYVRQRMDLDYYAANAGELKAPVVSGVSFAGKNLFQVTPITAYGVTLSIAEDGGIKLNGTATQSYNFETPVDVSKGRYTLSCPYVGTLPSDNNARVQVYRGNFLLTIANNQSQTASQSATADSDIIGVSFRVRIENGFTYNNVILYPQLEVGSVATDYAPHVAPISLSLPSTRLDGVGTAQDVMYVREDGENDYSLIKTAKMELVDLGTLTWEYSSPNYYFFASLNGIASAPDNNTIANIICAKYIADTWNHTAPASTGIDKSIGINGTYPTVAIRDSAYTDAATFKTAMSGVMLCYEKVTPTETVIAEHLTLADISAIAENGGIVSIVNENGHIVQPDFVADVVISRSAS